MGQICIFLLPQGPKKFFKVEDESNVFADSKGKGLDTWYSAAYIKKTREQQRFTILEVAADWHELMVPRRDMQPSIARDSGQVARGTAARG